MSLLPYHKGNKTKFTNLLFPLIQNNLIKNRTNEKNNQFIFRKISYLCSG